MQTVKRNGGSGYHAPARSFAGMLGIAAVFACTPPNGGDPASQSDAAPAPATSQTEDIVPKTIEDVLEARTPELMQRPGVIGVGQGLCEERPCIRVYVADESIARALPDSLDGYAVSAVVTGQVRAPPP